MWDGAEGVVRQTLSCGVGNALYTLDFDQGTAEVTLTLTLTLNLNLKF